MFNQKKDFHLKEFHEELLLQYPEIKQKIQNVSCLFHIETIDKSKPPIKTNIGTRSHLIPLMWKKFPTIFEEKFLDPSLLVKIHNDCWYFLTSRKKTKVEDACFLCTRKHFSNKIINGVPCKDFNVWKFYLIKGGMKIQRADLLATIWCNKSVMLEYFNPMRFFNNKLKI